MYSMRKNTRSTRNNSVDLIEINPSDANAYVKLSMSSYHLGQIQEFECALGLAMELNPENSRTPPFFG